MSDYRSYMGEDPRTGTRDDGTTTADSVVTVMQNTKKALMESDLTLNILLGIVLGKKNTEGNEKESEPDGLFEEATAQSSLAHGIMRKAKRLLEALGS